MTFKQSLQTLVNDQSREGRWFNGVIQCLIFVSVLGFSLETLPNLSPTWQQGLRWIEVGCVVVFTVEYIIRVWSAEHRLRFVFSFFGLIDLLAILPFYITTGLDLRSARVLRLLRLFRLLKVNRFAKALLRIRRAFLIAKEELIFFISASMIMIYLSSVGIYFFENEAQPEQFASIFHSLWWAVVTLTTVGYGDVYPITAGGRTFTFFILIIGLSIVSIPAGIIASALSKAREMDK